MRAAVLIVLSAIVVAACGRAPASGPGPGDQVLFIASGSSVLAVDSRSQAVISRLPLGEPSSDWRHFYAVSGAELQDLDPMTGSLQRSLPLPAAYRLPIVTAAGMPGGLSQNGRWLVLQQHDANASHFAVVETTSFGSPPRQFNLPGDFQFDAISNDGGRVYLIQNAGNGHYFVRLYTVGDGLSPDVVVDKSDGNAAMSGVRLMGVPAPGGDWLYSVYARPNESAFIHELNLSAPFALCVDLSGPGYAANPSAMRWSLALSADGRRLFAANSALGIVTEVVPPDGPPSGAARTEHLDGGPMSTAGGFMLTGDGMRLIVAGSGGIRWLDVSTLKTVATALPARTVAGIALSPDGKTVYAVSDSGQVTQLDSGGNVVSTFDPGVGKPIALLGVRAIS
jgi:hypothetical protein